MERNVAKCAVCKNVIESKSVHDFVSCSCGSIFIDGGMDYCRRGGNPSHFLTPTEEELKCLK